MDSKALRLGIACVALLGLAACGNEPPPITVTDSGPRDSGGAVDSGTPPRPDSGGGSTCGSLTGAGIPPLPASCLPRCATDTLQAAADCGTDGACQQAAFDADTTPSARVDAGGEIIDVDCGTCIAIQQNSCIYDSCPAELQAYLTCAQGGGACDTEEMAIDTCLTANDAAFGMCLQGTETDPSTGRLYHCFIGAGAAAAQGGGSAGASARDFDWMATGTRHLDFVRRVSLQR